MVQTEQSAGAVIYQDDDAGHRAVLLIRVRKDAYELPKGHIEEGESAVEAAVRECREEIGIESELRAEQFLGEIVYEFMNNEQQMVRKSVQYFQIAALGAFLYQKPKRTREIRWIKADELEAIPLVNNDLRSIIETVCK